MVAERGAVLVAPWFLQRGVAVRINATPKDADVYVDGYDGTFQRLHVVPGPHEITLYHGYLIDVDVRPGETTALTIRLRER
jgi:hypothetical protein